MMHFLPFLQLKGDECFCKKDNIFKLIVAEKLMNKFENLIFCWNRTHNWKNEISITQLRCILLTELLKLYKYVDLLNKFILHSVLFLLLRMRNFSTLG